MQYKTSQKVLIEKEVPLQDGGSFSVLAFAAWEDLSGQRHCFTTRAGGVSEDYLASLNFRRDPPDLIETEENLLENYRRAAGFFGVTPDRIVCAQQTHTANVRIVTEADAGKGVTRDRDYTDVDGIITDIPGLVLFTSHADCTPLYFYDPVRRVIALAHSGWKGTVARIGAVTIRRMQEVFGCRPQDIHAAIGPSICVDCYEVSEDVAEAFRECFGSGSVNGSVNGPVNGPVTAPGNPSDLSGSSAKGELSGPEPVKTTIPRILSRGRAPGKYQLDLWEANARILREAGIRPDHLTVTNLCTCCNSGELFSHRATGGRRGNQGAFLMME
jgi:YfiH family protein